MDLKEFRGRLVEAVVQSQGGKGEDAAFLHGVDVGVACVVDEFERRKWAGILFGSKRSSVAAVPVVVEPSAPAVP